MKKKDGSLSSCKSWGMEYNLLEAKPTLLERSYSRYGCRGFWFILTIMLCFFLFYWFLDVVCWLLWTSSAIGLFY